MPRKYVLLGIISIVLIAFMNEAQNALVLEWRCENASIAKRKICENASLLRKELKAKPGLDP